jgi:hypothetical protein
MSNLPNEWSWIQETYFQDAEQNNFWEFKSYDENQGVRMVCPYGTDRSDDFCFSTFTSYLRPVEQIPDEDPSKAKAPPRSKKPDVLVSSCAECPFMSYFGWGEVCFFTRKDVPCSGIRNDCPLKKRDIRVGLK